MILASTAYGLKFIGVAVLAAIAAFFLTKDIER